MATPTARVTVPHPAGAPVAGRREWWRFGAATAAALAAAGVVAAVDPNQAGHYPTCPFLAVTGLYCPGCGSLRALHDLLHLDPAGALQHNPLAVVLLPLVIASWVAWPARLSGRRAPHPTEVPAVLVGLLGVVILAFWVLRNVPGWTWLSPA
jgi:hypothetical protein